VQMKSEESQLICGVADLLKPFSFLAEGTNELVGYEVDLCKSLVSFIPNSVIEFKRVSLANRVPALLSGEVDFLIAGFGFSEERAKTVGYTSYYYHLSSHTLVKFVQTDISTSDVSIGYIKGSSALGVLKARFPHALLDQLDLSA
jgi:polar amino acid transport system substrate-binding protein